MLLYIKQFSIKDIILHWDIVFVYTRGVLICMGLKFANLWAHPIKLMQNFKIFKKKLGYATSN